MPRKPRLHVPGGLYHVILRGNDRQAIFFDQEDRRRWESLIAEALAVHRHRIHAYCWMTNHIHLAIQSHEAPLAGFVRTVASRYARSTNKKLKRTGHLFERRHRAILVQADSYLTELVRYIHLNPLRAAMVETITDYPWCSHRAYLSGNPPDWLTIDWVLAMFGRSAGDARRSYVRFMNTDCPAPVLQKLRGDSSGERRVLGDDDFAASIGPVMLPPAAQQTLQELAETICRQHDLSIADLRTPSRRRSYARIRAAIGLVAIDSGIASNAAVARFFGRSQSGMSRAINQARRQAK